MVQIMKIKYEHFMHMQSEIDKVVHLIPDLQDAIAADIRVGCGKVKNADKRLRWDLLFKAGLTRWICDNLYSYCDDTHIDTALRTMMRSTEGKNS